MEDFLLYNELQCMLLSMDSEGKINDIKAFIDKNHLFDNPRTLPTLKLIASVVYANSQYLNNAIKLLGNYDKIRITNPLFIGFHPGDEVLERSYVLYALLWFSNSISYLNLREYHCPYILEKIMKFIHEISPEKNKEEKEKSLDDLIFQAILDDDADSLQNLIIKNKININDPININYWIPSRLDKDNSPIVYSIILGSIRCFKFLLSNAESIDYPCLFKFAVQGKNKEIYNIIEQKINLAYTPINYIKYAIQFMNNELLDYFIQKTHCNLGTADIINCIYSSNYYAMLLFKKYNIYSIINIPAGINESTPIDTAVFEGEFYFVKYLVEVLRVDTHVLNNYGKTILQSAVKSNQIEIVKYIIKNNLVDVHDIGKWSMRPLDIAYFFGFNEMIAYLKKIIFKNGRTCFGAGKNESKADLDGTFYYTQNKNDELYK